MELTFFPMKSNTTGNIGYKGQLSKKDRICRKIIDFGLLGLIFFSPLPAASVYNWCQFVIEITVVVLLLCYFLLTRRPFINHMMSENLRWPRRLFIAFWVYVVIQIIPLPAFLIRILSPKAYAFRQLFLPEGAELNFMSLSTVPDRTLRDGVFLLSCFLIGFLIIRTVTTRRKIHRIVISIVSMGVFQAIYGLFELTQQNPMILFYKKDYNLESVTGTFINRNHFSGYLEMVIPLALGLIIARIDINVLVAQKWRDKIIHLAERRLSINLLTVFGIVVMALGIIYSKSRSGLFLLLLGFFLFTGMTFLFFKTQSRYKEWISFFLRISFIVIVLISLYMGIGATLDRFGQDNILTDGRINIWTRTIEIIRDFPITGSGLGTFSSVYLAYEKGGKLVRFSHAHNDYLEYLSDLGIVGVGFLAAGLIFMIVTIFLTWRRRTYHDAKGLGLGGFVALILILIHSLTDFNLHIPANMLLFSVVLSLTYVSVHYRLRKKRIGPGRSL